MSEPKFQIGQQVRVSTIPNKFNRAGFILCVHPLKPDMYLVQLDYSYDNEDQLFHASNLDAI